MSMPRRHQLPKVGDEYNEWTVLEGSTYSKWHCRCSCGNNCWVVAGDVRSGRSKRCRDCGNSRPRLSARRTHLPHIPNQLYNRLRLRAHNAIARCTDLTHPRYDDWGGRGIKVGFATIEQFVEYLLTLPGHDNQKLFLDRENNDGHYEPGNLRFVTPSESKYNQRCRK